MFSRLDRVKNRLGIRAAPSTFPLFGWGWNESAIDTNKKAPLKKGAFFIRKNAAAPYPDETSLAGLLSATVSLRPRAMFSRGVRAKTVSAFALPPSAFPPFGWGWNESVI